MCKFKVSHFVYLASDACSCSSGLIFSSTAEYVTLAFTQAASGAAAVLARLATCVCTCIVCNFPQYMDIGLDTYSLQMYICTYVLHTHNYHIYTNIHIHAYNYVYKHAYVCMLIITYTHIHSYMLTHRYRLTAGSNDFLFLSSSS